MSSLDGVFVRRREMRRDVSLLCLAAKAERLHHENTRRAAQRVALRRAFCVALQSNRRGWTKNLKFSVLVHSVLPVLNSETISPLVNCQTLSVNHIFLEIQHAPSRQMYQNFSKIQLPLHIYTYILSSKHPVRHQGSLLYYIPCPPQSRSPPHTHADLN